MLIAQKRSFMSNILLRLILFLLAVGFHILTILNSYVCIGICPQNINNPPIISSIYSVIFILLLIFLWKDKKE
jgi:hypothetical protein